MSELIDGTKPTVHTDAPATLRRYAADISAMADRGCDLVITCDTVAKMRGVAGALEWAAKHITNGWTEKSVGVAFTVQGIPRRVEVVSPTTGNVEWHYVLDPMPIPEQPKL